jgi:hypothetical protein
MNSSKTKIVLLLLSLIITSSVYAQVQSLAEPAEASKSLGVS